MKSSLQIILCFCQFVTIVHTVQAADQFVTLECPQGWKAFDQAWYVPKPENEDWTNPSVISPSAMEGYFESLYYKNGIRLSAMCLICKHDCKNSENCRSLVNKYIEICSYKFEELLQDPVLLEIVENFPNNTLLKWNKSHPTCGIKIQTDSNSLQTVIDTTESVQCPSSEPDGINNSSTNIALLCPQGSILIGFQNRQTRCSVTFQYNATFCIICKSSQTVISVCFNSCKSTPFNKFITLIISSSKIGITNVTFCGMLIDPNETLVLDQNGKLFTSSQDNFISCTNQNVTTLSLPIIAAIIGILTITMILIIAGAIVMNRLRNVHINTRDLQATPVHNNAYESGPPDSRVATISANAGNIQFFNNPYYR